MSKAGKAFLVVALIGAIATAVFAFMIVRDKEDKREKLEATTLELQGKVADLKKAAADLKTSQDTLTETNTKLQETTTKAEGLASDLDTAKKKAADLEKSVQDATAKVSAAEAKVEAVNSALGGKTPEAIKKEALDAQERLTALQGEKRVIDDQLAAANAEVKRLQDYIENSKTGKMPAGISGKIMTINKAWNFVVLDIGEKQGVVENGILIVYRGQKFIGKVKVVSTDANTSVADILPETVQAEIMAGDEVIN